MHAKTPQKLRVMPRDSCTFSMGGTGYSADFREKSAFADRAKIDVEKDKRRIRDRSQNICMY